jgi:hypothetical protein
MKKSLEDFYGHPQPVPGPFAGQLDPAFQRRLREAYADVRPEDCHFYHTLELGGGEVVEGAWDIRGNERNYLGHVAYDGLKVLEFGPASGYLSFWMESQGADVTIFDLPEGHPQDLLPLPARDRQREPAPGDADHGTVPNSWWYAHRKRGSRAKAVYGNIYHLPGDIGRHDVSTFGSILLHLGNPFAALEQAARVTDKALVVTEALPEVIFGDERNSFVEFNPGDEPENLVNWWLFSPGAIAKMLKVLGFPEVDVHFHQNAYHPRHDTSAAPVNRFMFTAVGQRRPGLLARLAKTEAEAAQDRLLREQVPVINVAKYNDAHRRLGEALAQLERIRNSAAWKLTKPLRMISPV